MRLQQFERRLERLVEGVFAKAFKGGLQPVELARRLTREMDLRRTVGVRGAIAPNRFRFLLATGDAERFSSFEETLTRELAVEAREHAKTERYLLVGPVEIAFDRDDALPSGTFTIHAEVIEGAGGLPAAALVGPGDRRVEIGAEPLVIGRSESSGYVLTDDIVSRSHAEVRRVGDTFVIVDLGSYNGTFVNGAAITEHRLSPGDEIVVGETRLRFESS